MAGVAAVAAAVAVALALTGPGRSAVRRALASAPAMAVGTSARASLLLVGGTAAAVSTVVLLFARGTDLALGLIAVLVAVLTARLMETSRRRRRSERREAQILQLCEMVSDELRAGQPPVTALRNAADVWPEFAPVAVAGQLGADVPAALRRLGRAPGAHGLLTVAAAWQVSQQSGGALASALAQVAGSVRDTQATHRLVSSELASAQATARVVALLPVGVLAMGAGIGGDPWGFLLHAPLGLACLGFGLALAFAGLFWIERIALAVTRR